MNAKIKVSLSALLLSLVLAGAWWAWDRGHIPGNPRAVSAAAMQPALLRHLMTVPRGQQGGCLAPDLAYPRPDLRFRGLKPGDRWCLHVLRWVEAWEAGSAPRVVLEATHENVLNYAPLSALKRYALDLN